ncbi:multicomponent Na+:H+ antiporter subunit G [Rhodopseudomonas julia]|uniref:Multicomponent Na+:H+ antiporter subunit G n=1 Tax=Rhodopseudomonas julia TaxID=200617 RepID=A0ABU0C3P7_9BRAD|nr:monovalent cation/H(+) antiporter subunit G [Rhodopseudomonas julia]MDQ0324561.1 multicomponent Na+:H+ antiporter subunit G [Rhodopseudomonas julia]
MSGFLDVLVGVMIVIGALFAVVASVGLLRFPDLYTRMHAASKAGTLGSGLMLLALALEAPHLDIFTRAVAGVVFFLLTAPVSAHLLARAAYLTGVKPVPQTEPDDYSRAIGVTRSDPEGER